MAVHPFARQCEQAIAKLREILANLKRSKVKPKEEGDEDQPPQYGTLADIPLRWLLPPPGMEHQAGVLGSTKGLGGTMAVPKKPSKAPKPPKPSGDGTYDRLSFKVTIERYKCQLQHIRNNSSYYRCRAAPGGTASKCKGLLRQTPCPGQEAAQRALDEYVKTKPPGWKPGQVSSGGGGGGGW
jgi:hypothetical protein